MQTLYSNLAWWMILLRAAVQVVDTLQKGPPAMGFVHSRKDTGKSARMLQMKAQQGGETAAFDCQEEDGWHFMQQEIDKSKNRYLCSAAYAGCVLLSHKKIPLRRAWQAGLCAHESVLIMHAGHVDTQALIVQQCGYVV